MASSILRETPVAQTPVSRPRVGMPFQHLKHGYVTVTAVEDGMVAFTRPGSSAKHGYINERQQPVRQFRAQTVDIK